MDVRPDDRIEPDDAGAFAATARACELAGWALRRVGAIDPVLHTTTSCQAADLLRQRPPHPSR